MSPESFQERPDQKDAADAKALKDAGAKQKPDGTWEAAADLGASPDGTGISTVQFRQVHGIWQWTNNSEPPGKWLGSQRFPTDGADLTASAKANRERMNRLADALNVKTDAAKENEINDADGKALRDAGANLQSDGTWEVGGTFGKSPAGTDIVTVRFRKVQDVWQWTNNSEPAGTWFGSPRFPTDGADLSDDIRESRMKMNKLADALHIKKNERVEQEQKMEAAADDYLEREQIAAGNAITPDVEYHVGSIDDSLGYIPFLEHVLEEMEDKDEWLGDGSNEARLEQNLLQNIAQSVRRNMNGLSQTLASANPKNGKAYERLRSLYVERAKRYTELVGSINEDEENVELRNAELAVEQAREMIPNMNIEEAIDWVEQALSAIDENDWQSSGLKETYGKLINTCKAGIQQKLAEEKGSIGNDPAKAAEFCRHAMELAKLFTDRGSPIDSDLTDIDFAENMAKDAMGFEELAMRYVEKQLGVRNPLKTYVAEKKDGALEKIANAPEETKNNPQVVEMIGKINGNPTSITDITDQYATLRMLEAQLNGEATPDIQKEINRDMLPVLEGAYVKFETFLDGTIGGAANLGEINAAIGDPPLSPLQVEAWQLLSDIQGYGYDVSDKTWSYVAIGAKIAAMIAAGIAVGIATGGLGVIAAMVAGGASMTAINAVVNQQGFDSIEDAFKTYGKDFAVNAATMGAARYISAGRTAFQLSRTGLLKEAGGLSKVFSIAGQKGGAKLLGSLDDASSFGTRLMGATGASVADLGVGTSLDTAIKGGQFMENLQSNAMFFGLGFAEFGQQGISGLWKKLRSAPDAQLHGLSQLVNKANLGRINIQKLTGGTPIEELLSSTDPVALLKKKNIGDAELKQIFEELDGLKKTKAEFEAEFKKAAALPDPPDVAAPQSNEEQVEAIKRTIMSLPDDADGLAKRVEGGAFVLGVDTTDITPAQRQAILDAHAVPMADGQKYSPAELRQKMVILEAAGFAREQADTLLRMGVCGVPPPPPVPPKKNAFGVPPPPPVPNRPRNNVPPAPPAPTKKPSVPDAPVNGLVRLEPGGQPVDVTLQRDLQVEENGVKGVLAKGSKVQGVVTKSGEHYLLSAGHAYKIEPGTVFADTRASAGRPTDAPAPQKKIRPQAEVTTEGVQASLMNFDLLGNMEQSGYRSVRKALASARYNDLCENKDAYERQVAAQSQKRGAVGKTDAPNRSPAEYKTFLETVGKTTKSGEYIGEANNSGINVFYGGGLDRNAVPGPLTVWIDYHASDTQGVFNIVDNAMKNVRGEMKFYMDSSGDNGGGGQIVVYLDPRDHGGIDTFMKGLAKNRSELETSVRPASYESQVLEAKIPLMPGVSMVERTDQRSWDTRLGSTFAGLDGTSNSDQARALAMTARKNPLDPRLWRLGHKLQPNQPRHANMPALRNDLPEYQ